LTLSVSIFEDILPLYGDTATPVDQRHQQLEEPVQKQDWGKVSQISQALLRDQAGYANFACRRYRIEAFVGTESETSLRNFEDS
jgi:hypothetical protein